MNHMLVWKNYHYDFFKEIIKEEKYTFSSPISGSNWYERYPNGVQFPII